MLSRSSISSQKFNALLASVAPGAGSAPAVAGSAYLGPVATGCRLPDNFITSRTQFNARSPHFARDTVTALKIVLPGFYAGQNAIGEKTTGANTSYTASVEYPAGTFTQVLFGGAAAGTATDGGMLTSDLVSVSIPRWALFWVRVFFTNSAGILLSAYGLNTGCGAALNYQASGATDQTMSGTITNNGTVVNGGPQANPTGFSFAPVAILAQTSQQSFAIIGDSRTAGSHDRFVGTNADQGNVARSIGAFAAYLNLSVSGETMADFIASHTNRLALALMCSTWVVELSINDVTTLGSSLATCQGNLNTIRGYAPAGTPVWLTTSEPVSTSNTAAITGLTSSGATATATVASTAALSVGQLVTVAGCAPAAYNTTARISSIPSDTTFTYQCPSAPGGPSTANGTYADCFSQPGSQTTNGNNAVRAALNDWKRGVPSGFKGCMDIADVVEFGRNSGLWTDVYGSATPDGTHPWSTVYLAIKASGVISPSLFA